MADNISKILDNTLLQMISEGYWNDYWDKLKNNTFDDEKEKKSLFVNNSRYGNTRARFETNGLKPEDTPNSTKITLSQAEYLYDKYDIVSYQDNDATGLSAIVFKEKNTNIYTISIRSTEYTEDFKNDALGADMEIGSLGFGFGQINSINSYYLKLTRGPNAVIPSTAQINITGYSLGGHLAHALYLLHPDEVNHVYLSNAPGLGTIAKDSFGNSINGASSYSNAFRSMMQEFRDMHDPETFMRKILNLPDADMSKITAMINFLTFSSSENNGKTTINIEGKPNTPSELSLILRDIKDNAYNLVIDNSKLAKNLLLMNNYTKPITAQANYASVIMDALKMARDAYSSGKNMLDIYSPTQNDTIYYNDYYEATAYYLSNKYGTISPSGTVDNAVFPDAKFTNIFGRGTGSINSSWTDEEKVANSNIHSTSKSFFINDQPKAENLVGKLPLLPAITSLIKGDFGNTHSITLLADGLNVGKLLQKIAPNIDSIGKVNAILSGANHEYTDRHAFSLRKNNVEAKSLSNVVDILYKIFVNPTTQATKSDSSVNSFKNLTEREALDAKINNISEVAPNNLEIISLMTEDGIVTSAMDMVMKAKQNNAQGLAYRYALKELNSIAVVNADYSSVNLDGNLDYGARSDVWLLERAKMLEIITLENYHNTGTYFSKAVYTDMISSNEKHIFSDHDTSIQNNILKDSLTKVINETDLRYNLFSVKLDKEFFDKLSFQYSFAEQQGYIYFDDRLTHSDNTALVYKGTISSDKIFAGNGNYTINLKEKSFLQNKQFQNPNKDRDYVELGYGNSTINVGDGYTEINTKGSALINMYSVLSKGKITFNGIELNGGLFNFSSGKYEQGSITYEFTEEFNTLKITDNNSEHWENNMPEIITINNFDRANEASFGLNFRDASNYISKTDTLDLPITGSNPYRVNPFIITGAVDGNMSSPNISLNMSYQDVIFYADNIDLYVYNHKTSQSYLFQGYKNKVQSGWPDGHLIDAYHTLIFNDNSMSISQFDLNSDSKTYDFSDFDSSSFTQAYYRDYDKIIISKNLLFDDLSYKKIDNDLVVEKRDKMDNLLASKKLINYFKFNHSIHTGIYSITPQGESELDFPQLKKLFVLEGSSQNDHILLNQNGDSGYVSVNAKGGQNIVEGSQIDEIFVVNGQYDSNKAIYDAIKETKILTGGGSDLIMIDLFKHAGNVYVKDYSLTDKIYLNFNTPSDNIGKNLFDSHLIDKDGDDLVITNGSNLVRIDSFFVTYADQLNNHNIYWADKNSEVLIDFSLFFNKVTNTPIPMMEASMNLSNTTTVQKVHDSIGDDTLVGGTGGTRFTSTSGHDTVTGGDGLNDYIRFLRKKVKDGLIIKDFKPNVDTLNIETEGLNVSMNSKKTNNDLHIYFTDNLNEPAGYIILENWFTNIAVLNANPSDNTGITLINQEYSSTFTPITYGQIAQSMNPLFFNYNGFIDASKASRNTVINTSGNSHVIGSNYDDDITGIGNNYYIASRGKDTYRFGLYSGTATLSLKELDSSYFSSSDNKITIKMNSDVLEQDVKLYTDAKKGIFSIKVGSSVFKIALPEGIDYYSVEKYFSIELFSGVDILKKTHEITMGNPGDPGTLLNSTFGAKVNTGQNSYEHIIGEGGHQILSGGYGEDIIQANKGHNIIYGGEGNDTLIGNVNNKLNSGNLIYAGSGRDNIFVGKNDVVIADESLQVDTIYTNSESYRLALMSYLDRISGPNNNDIALKLKNDGNDLKIGNSDNDNAYVILKDYYALEQNVLLSTVKVTDNHSYLHNYSLQEIMESAGFSKGDTGIKYLTYEDLQAKLKEQKIDHLYGGSLSSKYYNEGEISGFGYNNAQSILNNFSSDNGLLNINLYNDPNPSNKI